MEVFVNKVENLPFFYKKAVKSFGGSEKSRTFAPAKQESSPARRLGKSSLKDLHRQ
jgi:hypothetical protein